jgi:hypothetical protein
MLSKIEVPGKGPLVCGYRRSRFADDVPRFSATAAASPAVFKDINSIRAAAQTGQPIYAAIENPLLNDQIGDCAIAAALKIQAILDCLAGRPMRMPTNEDALWLYSQCSGTPPFNTVTRANDNGCELETVLAHWQAKGLYQDGYGKIKTAYAVDATKPDEVRAALMANHVLYAGCLLPKAWTQIKGTGFTWGMAGPPSQDEGHCTFMYGLNNPSVFDGTWGDEGSIPWDALAYYFGGQTGELYTVVAA